MRRDAGVLLSVTSLPSKYGVGCFDKAAYEFVDFLVDAGQRYWQILPLGATSHYGAFDSPYQAYSAFAGNPYFISPDALVKEGLLTEQECLKADFGEDPLHVNYRKLHENRLALLKKAYDRWDAAACQPYQDYIRENFWWLDDYALFMALKDRFDGKSWTQWPDDIRLRKPEVLKTYGEELAEPVEFQKFLQYLFFTQWRALKQYANDRHVQIVGDIPIYVSPDGSDIWAQPELFQLDENNIPTQIAGCPPDSFSADGQVWGNPLYRWEYHRQTGYHWWVTRMWYSYQLYDVVRIDHFRGFDEYFSIPADTFLAKDGHWEKGPGMELFRTLEANLGRRGVIAEDLGLLTPGVRQLVKESGFPNMKVLQFAFDETDIGGANEYLPHNYGTNCWVYTGTHDNETLAGWFAGLTKGQKNWVREYLEDYRTPGKEMYRRLIGRAMSSTAVSCIVPVQDWLGLSNDARMNVPGTVDFNWSWRLLPGQLTPELAEEMQKVSKRFGRANWDALHQKEAVRWEKVEESKEDAAK